MKKLLLLLISLSAFALSSFARIEGDDRDTYIDAEYYYLYENFDKALPLYLELIEKYPDNANINYRAGMCYLNMLETREDSKRTAVKYLNMELHKLPTIAEKAECFNVIVKYTLNASIRDKKRLGADSVRLYMRIFSEYAPSEVVEENLKEGFFLMCLDMRDPKGRMDPKLKKVLDNDPGFLEFVKRRAIEWKVDNPKEKKK